MSSILRTLSRYGGRLHPRSGGNQFSGQSPSHKALSSGKVSSPSSPFNAGAVSQKNPRKGFPSWKKWFFRCLVFFCIGALLGMAPVFEFEFLRGSDFPPKSVVYDAPRDNVVPGEVDEEDVIDFVPTKQLIVVTLSDTRAVTGYYLNRLGQTLKLVPPPLLWIVVEMNGASTETNGASTETDSILWKSMVMCRHIVSKKNLTDVKDMNVHLINMALEHIEHHKLDGIVYFAAADIVHSLELFESIRGISRFGTWPVGILANNYQAVLEGPVCNGSEVIGWHTYDKSGSRRFYIDMSGFAFNSTILWDPKRWQLPTSDPIRLLDTVKKGLVESTFVEQIVKDESQMEGVPPGCSKIMNWHSDLEAHELLNLESLLLENNLDPVTLNN